MDAREGTMQVHVTDKATEPTNPDHSDVERQLDNEFLSGRSRGLLVPLPSKMRPSQKDATASAQGGGIQEVTGGGDLVMEAVNNVSHRTGGKIHRTHPEGGKDVGVVSGI